MDDRIQTLTKRIREAMPDTESPAFWEIHELLDLLEGEEQAE